MIEGGPSLMLILSVKKRNYEEITEGKAKSRS